MGNVKLLHYETFKHGYDNYRHIQIDKSHRPCPQSQAVSVKSRRLHYWLYHVYVWTNCATVTVSRQCLKHNFSSVSQNGKSECMSRKAIVCIELMTDWIGRPNMKWWSTHAFTRMLLSVWARSLVSINLEWLILLVCTSLKSQSLPSGNLRYSLRFWSNYVVVYRSNVFFCSYGLEPDHPPR